MLSINAKTNEAAWRVASAMRGTAGLPTGERAYACAYLAHFVKSNGSGYDSLSEAATAAAEGNHLIQELLDHILAEMDEEQFLAAVEKTSMDDLRACLLTGPIADGARGGESSTPEGVASLVTGILDAQDGELVIDYGSGIGDFLEIAAKKNSYAEFVGVEYDNERAAVASMRTKFAESGIEYENSDMFAYYENSVSGKKADKVFSNYPWGMRSKYLEGRSGYLEKVLKGMSEYGRPTSADWVFNRLLVDSIKEDGIAVGIMTNGSAFNGADTRVRKYFIENGWVRAAVSLPAGLFSPWTGIATTLVVFGHGSHEGVRLVDATDLGTKERRGVILSEEDVSTILQRLTEDSDKSGLATIDKLAEREYTLLASSFLKKEIELVNPIAMKDLIVEATRGASLRAAELDELTCTEDTGIHYLNLANIVDGSIDDDLPCLKVLDPKLEKYCLETGDLLLSKNGAPYKVAVAEVPEGQKILANGNLYIIKLNTDKVDPYYIAAFLNSPNGKEILARASKGGFIPNLPVSELRAIKVPLEDAEKQARIAAAYQAKLDEIGVLKLRLSRARKELVDLFDKEG